MSEESPEQRFQKFLKDFKFGTRDKYREKLSQMASSDIRALEIDFEDLYSFDPHFARQLIVEPDEYLDYANRAIWAQMKIEDPAYAEITKNFIARFRGLHERISLREVGSQNLGRLVSVDNCESSSGKAIPYTSNIRM